jgi:acyl-CoA hydrolase
MDLVRVTGQIVSTGSSSMTVEVIAEKEDCMRRAFVTAFSSLVTMVVIDADTLRSVPGSVPQLEMQTAREMQKKEQVEKRKQVFKEWQKLTKERLDTSITAKDINEEMPNQSKRREYLTIPETQVTVRKQAMPRYLNHNQTIFGGDILIWMEKLATYTAKRFTGNNHVMTLTMNRVAFKHPILVQDVLHMEASVLYVRKYVLEVEIKCFVDSPNTKLGLIPSHTGYFTVMSLDSVGFKREIMVGIKLDDNDKESIERYLQAKERFEFDRTLKLQEEQAEHGNGTKISPAVSEPELDRIRYAKDEDDFESRFYLRSS